MKVELLRTARIEHKAGEIVEVSPETYNFLLCVGSARAVEEEKEEEEVKKPTRTRKTTSKGK